MQRQTLVSALSTCDMGVSAGLGCAARSSRVRGMGKASLLSGRYLIIPSGIAFLSWSLGGTFSVSYGKDPRFLTVEGALSFQAVVNKRNPTPQASSLHTSLFFLTHTKTSTTHPNARSLSHFSVARPPIRYDYLYLLSLSVHSRVLFLQALSWAADRLAIRMVAIRRSWSRKNAAGLAHRR